MQSCDPQCPHHLWIGLIAFVLGAVILLQKFDIVPDTTWGWLWPSILLVFGLKLMLSGCCTSTECKDSKAECCDTPCAPKAKTMKKAKITKKVVKSKKKAKATKKKK